MCAPSKNNSSRSRPVSITSPVCGDRRTLRTSTSVWGSPANEKHVIDFIRCGKWLEPRLTERQVRAPLRVATLLSPKMSKWAEEAIRC